MTNDIVSERSRYVSAFNTTMIEIWKERVVMLKAVDTGNLYANIVAHSLRMSADAGDISMEWDFPEYGLYVDRGTGREVARGNPGDIGRAKLREAKPWFNKAFYSSVMNLKEYMAWSFGQDAMAIFSNVFSSPVRGVL